MDNGKVGRSSEGVKRLVIGIISDTHGLLRPEAITALEGVDSIVHAGDIGSNDVLARLREIAPVVAVRGNNDREAWAAASLPEVVVTDMGGVRLCVIHEVKKLRIDSVNEGFDVVIYGHSHRPSVTWRDRVLLLNPGSAGPRRFTLPIAMARLRIGASGLSVEEGELDAGAQGAFRFRSCEGAGRTLG